MLHPVRAFFHQFLILEDHEWADFESCLNIQRLKKNELWLEEGQKCELLAFVDTGIFRFYDVINGEEKVTAFFFSGDFVSNYRSFLTGAPSSHYIACMQDAVIYTISKPDLQHLYQKYKCFERLGRFIAEKLYLSVVQRLDSFMFADPAERYQELVNRHSRLLQDIPQYMLASYLGVKPETLSRIRGRK